MFYATDVDRLKQKMTQSERKAQPIVKAGFKQFPHYDLRPGVGVQMNTPSGPKRVLGLIAYTERQAHLIISALESDEMIVSDGSETAVYEADYSVVLESAADEYVRIPSFTPPEYPIAVEGFIYTSTGEEDERVYDFKTDSDSQLQYYQVQVPLWLGEGNETAGLLVDAPFEPTYLPGFVYLPHYKGERVLLHLFHEGTRIKSSLDWGPGIQSPLESLGQNIHFGKVAKSETAMTHVYEDNKPVFSVARTDAGATQTITRSENVMILEVKQDTDDEAE